MILDRFDNDLPKYYEWSLTIREMVNYSVVYAFEALTLLLQIGSRDMEFQMNRISMIHRL